MGLWLVRWLLARGMSPAFRARRGCFKPTVPRTSCAPLGARGKPSIAGLSPLFSLRSATRKNSPFCGALERSFAASRRPEGSALWTPAAFEKAGETFTAYGGAVYGCCAAFLLLTSNLLSLTAISSRKFSLKVIDFCKIILYNIARVFPTGKLYDL